MLTYANPNEKKPLKTYEKPWLLILLTFVWLWPGIINHDLWNPNEPYIYAAIQYISTTKDFISPKIYNYPYIDNSPIYLYFGMLFKKLFYPWAMSKYTAIRLTTVFFMVLSLIFVSLAGKMLLGAKNGRSVGLILLGCPGIIIFAHIMSVLPILLTAYSIFAYSISINAKKPVLSGFFMGLGFILSFLSNNLFPIIILIIILLLLPLNKYWRNKRYIISIVFAIFFAIPIILIWPYALLEINPDFLKLWLKYHLFSSFGGINNFHFGFGLKKYLTNIIWYTFPACTLVIFTIIKERKNIFKNNAYFLCTLWFIVASIALIFENELETNDLIHIIIPLSILAAAKLDYLKMTTAAFLNWLGITIFGTATIIIWVLFFAINYNIPNFIAQKIYKINSFYKVKIDYFPIIIAIIFVVIWLIAVTRKHIKGRQAITNWTSGVTLTWTLILTLFLPWINSVKSHRFLVQDMAESLPSMIKEQLKNNQQCINSNNKIVLITWNEYGKIPVYQNNENCKYLIEVVHDNINIANNWKIIWKNNRPNKKNENYILLMEKNKY